MRTAFLLGILCGTVLLAGCAQTSQQLHLDPRPDYPAASPGNGLVVAVSGADARPEAALGVLENRRSEDAELTTEQDLGELVALAVADMLRAGGFEANVQGPDGGQRQLEVVVERLEHHVSSAVPRQVRTQVELSFEARNGERRLTGRNRHSRSDTVSGRPGAGENAAYVDQTLAGGLERLLRDELLTFRAEP